MAANAKVMDNMTKNLTKAEAVARAKAETETLPERTSVRLNMPMTVKRDSMAKRYWQDTLRRMDGITLLDDLDTEMLAVYCTMLSRRDAMNELCRKLIKASHQPKMTPDEQLESMSKLDSLMGKLQGQERNVLAYAEKLGLTPAGRVRLARKRAEARTVEAEDDLFGD